MLTKNVLVTGGAGYIGSHTVSALENAGYTPIVLDNLSTGFKESLNSNVIFVQGCISDHELINTILKKYKIESVIHFAAKLIVEESVRDPELYYSNNLINSFSFIKACIESGVKNFLFSSTAAVYGNTYKGLISEEFECNPINPYGKSKLFIENILKDLSNVNQIKFVALRYFNVAGANIQMCNGQRTKNATHLIKVASEAACGKRKSIHVFGGDYSTKDGTCVRDYIHILDLVSAHLDALKYLEAGGASDIFNCGYGNGYSVLEVLETMKKVSLSNFQIRFDSRRSGDAESVVADVKKISNVLKWKPKFNDLSLICESSYLWEKSIKS